MLRPLPNWFYGLLPESLWPDRPREFYNYTLNIIPLAAGATAVVDVVFSKKTDTLIFGGAMIRTSTDGVSIFNPRSGGAIRALIQMSNSASNELFTDRSDPANGLGVPMENLFASWGPILPGHGFVNAGAKLPAFWPIPIYVPKGGALSLKISDLAATASHFRFTFWGGLIYQLDQREVA